MKATAQTNEYGQPSMALPRYPTIELLLRHGPWLFALIALLPLLAAIAALPLGAPLWLLPITAVASAVAFLLLRAFLELMQILADFILPR